MDLLDEVPTVIDLPPFEAKLMQDHYEQRGYKSLGAYLMAGLTRLWRICFNVVHQH